MNLRLATDMDYNMQQSTPYEEAGAMIAGRVQIAEEEYLTEASKGDKADPALLAARKTRYQKFLEIYETFNQMMTNRFQTLMQGIRSLSVR